MAELLSAEISSLSRNSKSNSCEDCCDASPKTQMIGDMLPIPHSEASAPAPGLVDITAWARMGIWIMRPMRSSCTGPSSRLTQGCMWEGHGLLEKAREIDLKLKPECIRRLVV